MYSSTAATLIFKGLRNEILTSILKKILASLCLKFVQVVSKTHETQKKNKNNFLNGILFIS